MGVVVFIVKRTLLLMKIYPRWLRQKCSHRWGDVLFTLRLVTFTDPLMCPLPWVNYISLGLNIIGNTEDNVGTQLNKMYNMETFSCMKVARYIRQTTTLLGTSYKCVHQNFFPSSLLPSLFQDDLIALSDRTGIKILTNEMLLLKRTVYNKKRIKHLQRVVFLTTPTLT